MNLTQVKLLWTMTVFEAQRFKAYPHEIVATIGARLAELTLYGTFWLLVGHFSPGSGINAVDVFSYYLIISGLTPFLYSGFGFAGMALDLIKNGQLTQALIRPVNPILYPWALRTGRNAINLVFGVVQIAVGMAMAGGMRVEALPFLVPVLWNAVVINFALNVLISTVGFYTTEGRGIKNTSLHIASFARGDKMPIFLMTPELAQLLFLTPFPASQYHLAILFQGTRLPVWSDVLVGLAWSAVLLFAAFKLWRHGLKRYEAIGI